MASWSVLLPAALSLGLASSAHCALMCGPLAACVLGSRGARGGVSYQLGRLGSYGVAGALAGGVGGVLPATVAAQLSWLGAGVLVLSALGVGVGRGSAGGRWMGGVLRRVAAWPEEVRGLLLGAVTALLPCGVLASALLVAMATTEALAGSMVMAVFALGTMPLLVAGQLGWATLSRGRWAPRLPWLQRLAFGLGALTLFYRGWAVAQGASCH